MYHLFSGKHQVPPPRFIQPNPQFAMTGVSVASLIDKKMGGGGWKRGGGKGGKKKSGFDKSKKNTHSPFPFNRDMETTIDCGACGGDNEDMETELPELVSLESLGAELLECHNTGGKKKDKKKKKKNSNWMNEEMPDLVSSDLPELVSLDSDLIECHNRGEGKHKKKKDDKKIKWLVDNEIGDELIEDDFSDFPPVDNVFKQTVF
jgi:hypothetical protein